MVEQDEQLRPHAGDLADQLRADRSAGAGDQDALVLEVGADAVELHHHRVAAEDVLDPDLAQLAGELDAAAQELEHGRQGSHRDLALTAGGDYLAAQDPRGRRDRDHDLVRRELVADPADLVGGPEHLEPDRAHVALRGIVVDEADRVGAERRIELQLADHHLAARAGADHEHAARALGAGEPLRALSERSAREPGAAEQGAGEDEVEDHDRAREAVRVGLREHEDEHEQGAGDGERADQRP